jgi:capsid protein
VKIRDRIASATGGMFAYILDAAERSRARKDLHYFGRAQSRSEDRLLPHYEIETARQRLHDARRNNPLIAGIGDRFADSIIGNRLVLHPRTKDEAWNKKASDFMLSWMRRPTVDKRRTMLECAKTAVSSRLWDGESFYRKDNNLGLLHPLEAERIRPPQGDDLQNHTAGRPGALGAHVDPATGEVLAWCVHGRDKDGGFFGDREQAWIPSAEMVGPVGRLWRFDQVRCLPELAPVANLLVDMNEVNQYAMNKMKADQLMAWIHTRSQSSTATLRGRGGTNVSQPAGTQPLSKMDFGQIFETDGELQSFASQTPGNNYEPFMEMNLRIFCACIGLPYEYAMLFFGKANFSSSKATRLLVQRTVESWQTDIAEDFFKPIIWWRISLAIMRGELPAAPVGDDGMSEFWKWEWQVPSLEWIDEQNAVQAEMQTYLLGATTLSAINGRRGRDLEETLRIKAKEKVLIKSIAKEFSLNPEELSFVQIPGQKFLESVDPSEGEADNKLIGTGKAITEGGK